ncbi:MAG: HlyD family efflux transporter periplasmic adaptor subunit [Pseudomonadota bacterium]
MIANDVRAAPIQTADEAAGTSRALDAAWAALAGAETLADMARPWLTLQSRMAGAEAGAVYALDADGGCPTAHVVATLGGVPATGFEDIAAKVFETGRPATIRPEDAPAAALLGHPVAAPSSETTAVVAVLRLADVNPQRVRNAARALAWGAVWLREALASAERRRTSRREDAMRAAHEIFAAMIEDHQARRAAIGAVTRLARAVEADRVSVGFRRRGAARVFAVSHTAEFRKEMNVNRLAAAAMDEAIDQRAALSHPAPEREVNGTRAQKELAERNGREAVLSVPFMIGGVHQGAFTFQRDGERPFDEDETAFADFAASLVGPVLWDKKQNEKWLVFKALDTAANQFARLFGPGFALRKIVILVLIGLTALFSLWERPYRIASDAVIEGASQRSIVAPFDGFLREASLRPGDRVREGEVIAALDDRDLVLERLRWIAERQQKRLELGRAIGEQNRAASEIFRVQIAQAEAQVALIDARLERMRLLAPFDGVIVAGDQSQNIGGSVGRGALLFEVAPVDDYRVVMDVDESRIGEIAEGQTGDIVVTALPQDAFPFRVEKITPVSQAAEGRNTFRVEGRFDEGLSPSELGLSPGMRGVGKVNVEDRLVISIWTRELLDWARLTIWKWFG